MSDRRRYPKQDDWDDDLDLAGFDRPASGRRPASGGSSAGSPYDPSASAGRSGQYPEDDAFADPGYDDPYSSTSSRQRSSGDRSSQSRSSTYPDRGYQGQSGYEDDFYDPSPERQSYSSRTPDADRYGRSSSASTRYGSDFIDEPAPRSAPRSRQQAPSRDRDASYGYDERAYADPAYADTAYDASYPESPAAPRRATRSREARQRPSMSVPMPAINDGLTIGVVAVSLLSIVFMIASIAAGTGDLPESFPIHLDASGNADAWGNSDTLWRIPLGALFALLMALVIAAVLWKRDRFAARFAVFGTVLVQVLAWVALVDFIW